MKVDAEKLRKDRREALFMALNAENDLRREVVCSSLITQLEARKIDVERQKQAAGRYLESLQSFEALDILCREIGVQP